LGAAPTFSSLSDLVAFFSAKSQISALEGLKNSRRVNLKKSPEKIGVFPQDFALPAQASAEFASDSRD
jgi:hypothetical protein